MLVVSETYTKHIGRMGMAHFQVSSTLPGSKELYVFWLENKDPLQKPVFGSDTMEGDYVLEFKLSMMEKVKNLIYRFNMALAGQNFQLAKREFLNQFGIEAVRAIIYATDFCPDSMGVDDYIAVVLKAFEDYSDSAAFDDRLINVSGLTTDRLNLIINQIQLFKNLLIVPMEDPWEKDNRE